MTQFLPLTAGGLTYVLAYDPSGTPNQLPIPPTEYTVPAYSLPTGGTTYTPANGTEFQTALTNCSPGDVIILDADTTYTTGNNQSFTLPAKTASEDWIYIISSVIANLPEGTRVSPSSVTHMPKVTAYSYLAPAMIVSEGACKVRFAGIEVTTDSVDLTYPQYGLIRVGWKSSGTYSATSPAKDVIFERCYIHGTNGKIRDGLVLYNVAGCAIRDCYISDFKGQNMESHGIHCYIAPGPTLIHNNYIEAAAINVFVGDSTTPANDTGELMVPADVTVTNNHIFKQPSWNPSDPSYGGVDYLVKNLWETKGVLRCLVEGNVMDNSWGNQAGVAIVVKSVCGNVEDCVIRNNLVTNSYIGVVLSVQAYAGGSFGSSNPLTMSRVTIDNNLFISMLSSGGGNFQFAARPSYNCTMSNLRVRHNTYVDASDVSSGAFCYLNGEQNQFGADFICQDNIGAYRLYGLVTGLGTADGLASYTYSCPLATVGNNALVLNSTGAPSTRYGTSGGFGPWYFSSDTSDVGFVDLAGDEPADFALTSESPYYQAGSDGTDIGANMTTLAAAISGVVQ